MYYILWGHLILPIICHSSCENKYFGTEYTLWTEITVVGLEDGGVGIWKPQISAEISTILTKF